MTEAFTSKHAVKPDEGFDVSASGLGEEFARSFAKAGAFVTIGDLSEEHGKRVASEIGEDKVAFVQCNVLTWKDQVALFKTAIERSPSKCVDIVLANAGISGQDAVWKDDAAEGDSEPVEPNLNIIKTNLIGVMYTTKLAVHYLNRNPPGHDRSLIMTASLAGYLDQPGSPQYCASKWGVRGMMRSLRQTMPNMSMRVNIIAPWFIQTRIISEEVINRLEKTGIDFAEKEDAAAAVLHMASDPSINGRSCAVVPRRIAPKGYMDLQKDDFAEGDVLTDMQGLVKQASHRVGTK